MTLTASSSRAGGCFTPDTGIWMADMSYRPIAELRNGDTVVAWHEQLNAMDSCKISQVHRVAPAPYRVLVLDHGGDLHVTPDHEVRAGGRWVAAGELRVGDVLCLARHDELIERRLTDIHEREAGPTLYDLRVEGGHCYFADGVLVRSR